MRPSRESKGRKWEQMAKDDPSYPFVRPFEPFVVKNV